MIRRRRAESGDRSQWLPPQSPLSSRTASSGTNPHGTGLVTRLGLTTWSVDPSPCSTSLRLPASRFGIKARTLGFSSKQDPPQRRKVNHDEFAPGTLHSNDDPRIGRDADIGYRAKRSPGSAGKYFRIRIEGDGKGEPGGTLARDSECQLKGFEW